MYENLKKLIKAEGYSQEQYAKLLYVVRSNWYNKMRKKIKWSTYEKSRIMSDFGYDLEKRDD